MRMVLICHKFFKICVPVFVLKESAGKLDENENGDAFKTMDDVGKDRIEWYRY